MIRKLGTLLILWAGMLSCLSLLFGTTTWNTFDGGTVGSSSGNISKWNGLTIGTSSGNINAWNNLAAPSGGGGTVVFDAVGPSGGAGTSGTSNSAAWTTFTLTWTHVVTTSGSNLGLIAGCTFTPYSTSVATIAVTYNGTSMTSDGSVLPDNTSAVGIVYLFHLIAPSTGSHSVVATATYVSGTKSSSDGMACGSISFTGVNQTTMTAHVNSNYGSGTAASLTVTSATNDMVVDMIGDGSGTTSSNKTLQWKLNSCCSSGGAANSGAQSTASGASSVTMGYTIASDYWGEIGADIQHN